MDARSALPRRVRRTAGRRLGASRAKKRLVALALAVGSLLVLATGVGFADTAGQEVTVTVTGARSIRVAETYVDLTAKKQLARNSSATVVLKDELSYWTDYGDYTAQSANDDRMYVQHTNPPFRGWTLNVEAKQVTPDCPAGASGACGPNSSVGTAVKGGVVVIGGTDRMLIDGIDGSASRVYGEADLRYTVRTDAKATSGSHIWTLLYTMGDQ